MKIKLKHILIGIILLNILIMIILVIKNNKLKNSDSRANDDNPVINVMDYEIFPENFSTFYLKYKGQQVKSDLFKKLYKFINVDIVNLYNNKENLKNDLLVEQYYNDNKKQIRNDFGITNINDFQNLILSIQKFSNSNIEYERSVLEKESYTDDEKNVNFILNVKYKNEESIKFRVYFSKILNSSEPLIKFIPIIE